MAAVLGASMAGGLEWWTSGRHGTLSPWSQALVFALTTVSDKKSLNLTDTEIATEVVKIGGGHSPGKQSDS